MERILLILLASGLWHSSASAADYFWSTQGGAQTQYRSASAACYALFPGSTNYPMNQVVVHPPGFNGPQPSAECKHSGMGRYGWVFMFGACADYDPITGECVAPEEPEEPEDPCADKAGTDTPFSKAGTAPDGFAFVSSGGMGGTQRQGCKGGCATEIIDNRCKWGVGGAYYCRGTATYTGQQCATTGTGDQIDEDTNESAEPETIKEDVPCIYSAVGGKQVCESKKSEEKEGQSCGTVNGVQTCVDKAPTKNEVDIKTEITTETNQDGSTTTTKTDTATITKCSGINSCTTSTTTNTTTTQKDGDGNVTSVSGMCVGEHCPDKKTDPDGDGDGLGDCATGDCGEGEGGQDWFQPGEDTFASVLEKFSSDVLATPVASQTTHFMTFNASGSCPRWTVNAWVFDIRLEQLCTGDIPWAAIKAIILAASAFFAFRIAFL